jgi:hypothetical protein
MNSPYFVKQSRGDVMYQTLNQPSMTGVTYGCDFAHHGPVSIGGLHHPAPREGLPTSGNARTAKQNSRTAEPQNRRLHFCSHCKAGIWCAAPVISLPHREGFDCRQLVCLLNDDARENESRSIKFWLNPAGTLSVRHPLCQMIIRENLPTFAAVIYESLGHKWEVRKEPEPNPQRTWRLGFRRKDPFQ